MSRWPPRSAGSPLPARPRVRVGSGLAARARFLLAATACGLVLAGAGAPAAAAPEATPDGPAGRVSGVAFDDGSVAFLLTADGLEAADRLDPASVRATLAGQPLEATVRPASERAPGQLQRIAVLVMDLSGSMRAALPAAKRAATAFVDAMPADVAVGLVTFADEARTVVKPTTERDAVRSSIGRLRIEGATALYKGVTEGIRAAGSSGSRTLVVLSDGGDTESPGGLPDVLARLRASGARLDAVPLGSSGNYRDELEALTRAGGRGRIIEATDAGDLGAAFGEAASSIAAQVLVSAPVPDGLATRVGDTVQLDVQARAGDTPVRATASVRLPAGLVGPTGPRPVPVAGPGLSRLWLALGTGGVFAGLAVLVGTALVATAGGPDRETRILRRMSLYTLTGRGPRRQSTVTSEGGNSIARTAVELANRLVQRRDYEARLMRRLDAAGVPIRPAEWVIIHTGAAIVGGLLLLLLGGGSLLGLLLGLLLGAAVPVLFLAVKRSRRHAAFSAQLPDVLMLLAGSLGAGYSMPQAIDAVVREGREPVAAELNRALVEARLGVPLEEALEHVAERMRSRDFSWVVMAIRIQREVGGNLSEVLRSVAATLRERDFLRRQISALSAEGRLSALILALLPPFFVTYLAIVRPAYLALLFTSVVGLGMVVIGVTLLVVGLLWMRRIVQVEV